MFLGSRLPPFCLSVKRNFSRNKVLITIYQIYKWRLVIYSWRQSDICLLTRLSDLIEKSGHLLIKSVRSFKEDWLSNSWRPSDLWEKTDHLLMKTSDWWEKTDHLLMKTGRFTREDWSFYSWMLSDLLEKIGHLLMKTGRFIREDWSSTHENCQIY